MLMEQANFVLSLVVQKLKKFFLLHVVVEMVVMEDKEGMEVGVVMEEMVEMVLEEVMVIVQALVVVGMVDQEVMEVMVEMVVQEAQVEEEEMGEMQAMEGYV